ncbi:hypothetical protein ACGFY7_50115 [Streptomyces prunicolor]|uniref:hypothetical protein n=1 Tax=Streptomyces prunicolor TaxID=67348 RepID=UPI00371C5FCA
MTIEKVDLTKLLDYWSEQRNTYAPSAYVMLLCGAATELDRQTFSFVVQNRFMLTDMSGPYTSLTLVGSRSDGEVLAAPPSDRQRGELGYLHGAYADRFHASGVFDLANALNLPLDQFPLIVVSLDPWARDEILTVSLRDLPHPDDPAADRTEQLVDFFAALLTACRTTRGTAAGKRLRLIQKHMKPHLDHGRSGWLNSVSESGILAQVIEGIIRGLGLGGA